MQFESARLIVRELEPADSEALAEYQRDPRYVQHHEEAISAERLIELARAWRVATPRKNFQLAIVHRKFGHTIGSVGIRQEGYRAGEAEIGIEIDPNRWGIGLAKETLASAIVFARDDLSIDTLYALVDASNDRVCQLLHAAGFTRAGAPGEAVRYQLPLSTV